MKAVKHFFRTGTMVLFVAWMSALISCATSSARLKQAEEGVSLEMTPIVLSGIRPSEVPVGSHVFNSDSEWNDFWSKHSFRPAPDIDFDKYTLLLVFLGREPNPGYSISITEAREHTDKVVVHVIQTHPAPDMMYAQVIVYPYDAVLIPKTEKPVQFETVEKEDEF